MNTKAKLVQESIGLEEKTHDIENDNRLYFFDFLYENHEESDDNSGMVLMILTSISPCSTLI